MGKGLNKKEMKDNEEEMRKWGRWDEGFQWWGRQLLGVGVK